VVSDTWAGADYGVSIREVNRQPPQSAAAFSGWLLSHEVAKARNDAGPPVQRTAPAEHAYRSANSAWPATTPPIWMSTR